MIKKHRLLLIKLALAGRPLTSREVADAISVDYRRNFNKREARYAKKLAGFIVRQRPAEEQSPKVLHWSLAEEWKGRRPLEVIKALIATERAKDELRRELQRQRIYAQMGRPAPEVSHVAQ